MAINKNEINKYIFDPENPKQCLTYNALFRIAKTDNNVLFSPSFLQYFFAKEILNDDFRNQLWDIPENYDLLSFNDKIELFIEQLSENNLTDFVKEIDEEQLNFDIFNNYTFLNKLLTFRYSNFAYHFYNIEFDDFKNYVLKNILKSDLEYLNKNYLFMGKKPSDLIIFTEESYHILNSVPNNASIVISLEKNIDKFLKYGQNIIKPIFLKKIEDVDLLLDILQKDIEKYKSKDIPKKDISNIKSISIENFFSIKNMKLDNLKDKKEIYILGENGDGKTLLLQAITCALKGTNKDGQGSFRDIKEKFNLTILDTLDKPYNCDENVTYENLLAYGANRHNNSNTKEDESGYLSLFTNQFNLKNPIKWLITLDHSQSKGEKNFISVSKAKQLIKNLLNKEVDIEINSTNVIFKEKGSTVEFDRLSAGYKGVITIICDMLERLAHKQPYITNIEEFQGIVLIDEVELHLHPRWQYSFMQKLRELFPLIQFVVTTHSPTVILGASKEAVFYKITKNKDGETCISKQQTITDSFLNDISTNIFSFDVNYERINNPSKDNILQNAKAKKELLSLIDIVQKDK